MNKLNLDSIIENNRNKNTMFNYYTEKTTKNAIKQAIKEALPIILQEIVDYAIVDYNVIKDSEYITNGSLEDALEVYLIAGSVFALEKEILNKLLGE